MIRSLAALALALGACAPPPPQPVHDQCLRARLFQECLARVPVGPTAPVTNDWAELVAECESAAYYQSYRHPDAIPPGCSTVKP
jgi:hypothetical protein